MRDAVTLENNFGGPQNVTQLPCNSAIPLLGIYIYSRQKLVHRFLIESGQSKHPSTTEWINKRWYIHVMECYLVIKRNEVLTHATIWMNFENNLLSERSQIQKARIICNVQNRHILRDIK